MSAAAVHRALWIALVLAWPVPILLLGPGRVPAAQLAQLGGAALAFGLAESLRGVVGLTATIFLAQALLWACAFWWLASRLVRWLGRARAIALAAALLLVAVASVVPVYRTPYHARFAETTLLEVYR